MASRSKTPTAPLDRLPKVSRRISQTFVMDDEAADEYEAAKAALEQKRMELEGTAPRRAAAVRSMMPATVTPEEVEAAVQRLLDEDKAVLEPLEKRLFAADRALSKATVRFVLKALPRADWKALKKKHSEITDDDRAQWMREGGQGEPEFSLSSITEDLLVGAIVEPALTPAAILEMVHGEDWNESEIQQLRNAAILVQGTYRPSPKDT